MKRFAMDDHCMAVPGEEGEKQVQQRANAVLALLKLGQASTVWPLFAYQPDPRLQSYLTCRASLVAVPTALLIDRMYTESNPDALYTLILLLGRFDPNKAIDPGVLARLERWLWDTYENHRDSGVHAAVHWVLRRWGHGEALDARDLRLAKLGATDGCNWYHNALGQLMVVIRHPSEVLMGMEDGEQQTKRLGPRHFVRPPRPFAIAATETTLRHYRQYRSEELDLDALARPERPVYEKSLYEAFGFCDWLTRIERRTDEGLVPKQFDPVKKSQPDIVVNLETSVYRLPTELEWEYACRAGSITSRFFGGAYTMLLNEYAIADSTKESMPVGHVMPNRLGLFDTYGNVSEWTVDAFELPQPLYDMSPLRTISRDVPRVVRGGGYSSNRLGLRSALRLEITPYYSHPGNGFRVARTMLPDGA
jgi:formylglycine-generating enzyme required for sulfatase activity